MVANVTWIDLPYDSNNTCRHWLEFRDYLIGNDGKQYVQKYIYCPSFQMKRNMSSLYLTEEEELCLKYQNYLYVIGITYSPFDREKFELSVLPI
jgi:hypothetical protein